MRTSARVKERQNATLYSTRKQDVCLDCGYGLSQLMCIEILSEMIPLLCESYVIFL